MNNKFLTAILMIPVINVLANTTTNYFAAGTINPGFLRMLYLVGIIIFFLLHYKIPYNYFWGIIIIFLSYNFILVLFNPNLLSPIINFIKIALPFFMLIIGFTFISNQYRLNKLFKFYMIALCPLCLNYMVANIFGLGPSVYLEDSFYLGGASAGLANEISVFIIIGIIFLLMNNEKKWHYFTIILIVFSMLIILLTLRRGAFLCLGAGILVVILLTDVKYKTLKYVMIACTLLAVLFPIYSETLNKRYEYRKIKRDGSLLNYQIEGRYIETGLVINEISNGEISKMLFGTYNLNSATYFGKKYGLFRELHVGYMAILHGSGFVGLLLFGSIFVSLSKNEQRYYRHLKKEYIYRQINALFFALIAVLSVYFITSRLHGFGVTIPVFLMIGGIIGTMKNKVALKKSR